MVQFEFELSVLRTQHPKNTKSPMLRLRSILAVVSFPEELNYYRYI